MKYYVADAFTDHLFGGNPAGICICESELDESIMQSIAAENNLSETAFLTKYKNHWKLRWFTPNMEIDLCGHATLAAAHILYEYEGIDASEESELSENADDDLDECECECECGCENCCESENGSESESKEIIDLSEVNQKVRGRRISIGKALDQSLGSLKNREINDLLDPEDDLHFLSKSGVVTVSREGGLYYLDFPSRMPEPCEEPAGVREALRGADVVETWRSRDLVVVLNSEEEVRELDPDLELVKELDGFGLIVTARGNNCDFVSRFFAPKAGISEDSVTGSAHSTLIPFWSRRLNKTCMIAQQLSKRGGVLYCVNEENRVKIGGKAVCYMIGEIQI